MHVNSNEISGVETHKFVTHLDSRGTFSRFPIEFNENQGLKTYFATALSFEPFTLRGLHSQTLESPETKYVYCISGKIYDVVVDLRPNSDSFGDWTHVILGPTEELNGITVPAGCAHGYLTLHSNTSVVYRIDGDYNPRFAKNLKWDDPLLKIVWPEIPTKISDNDRLIEYLHESELRK